MSEDEKSDDNAYCALKGNILASRDYSIGNKGFILVPWFSNNEWKEVYENIFSNDCRKWKAAYCQMNVWKARCPSVAVGIESSIPLLHAMIAQADKAMEDSFKDSIVNLAIVRFVSIASKGFEKTFNHRQNLHNLASRMNIPGFLVGLRNGIIHNDNIAGSLSTLEAALESCFSWIKKYYWDKESNYLRSLEDIENDTSNRKELKRKNSIDESTPSKKKRKRKKKKGQDDDDSDVEEIVVCYKNISESINKFFKLSSNEKSTKLEKSGITFLLNPVEKYYKLSSSVCIQVIVDDLLCSKYILESIEETVPKKGAKKFCTYVEVPDNILTHLFPLVGLLHKLGAINDLIFSLIGKSEAIEYSLLCFAWIRVFALTCNSHGNSWLQNVSYREYHARIKWNEIVFELMSTAKRKHIEFALEISKLVRVFKEPNSKWLRMDLLISASEAFLGPKAKKKKKSESTEINEEESILTVKDVLREARKSSKEMLKYVKDLTSYALEAPVDILDSSVFTGTPLGLLPHQVGDPDFYKKLILDIES